MLKDVGIKASSLYMGRNAGSRILERIDGAMRSIKILTPYVSAEYIQILKTKASNGVEVALIVSSDFANNDITKKEILRSLYRQIQHTDESARRRRRVGFRLTYALFAVAFLIIAIGLQYKGSFSALGLLALPILVFVHRSVARIRVFTYTYERLLNFRVTMSPYTDGFNSDYYLTHAKMYLIDDVAYLGSINFTKAAFQYNYETRIEVDDPTVIRKMEEEFNYLFSNEKTFYLDVDSMAHQLYNEAAN